MRKLPSGARLLESVVRGRLGKCPSLENRNEKLVLGHGRPAQVGKLCWCGACSDPASRALCQAVTEDGHLDPEEIAALLQWLDEHRSSDLPAIGFLTETLARILADGRVTPEEQRELYLAIETVLPMDIRASVRGTRVSRERELKVQANHAREAEDIARREARDRNSPVDRWDFMVAGVRYEGRPDVIARYCVVQEVAYLCRDRANRFSRNAVEVRLSNGMQAGYVPEELAIEMAPLLDGGHRHRAYVKKILRGGRVPIPVIIADLFVADCGMADAVSESQVPATPHPLSMASANPPAAQESQRWWHRLRSLLRR